MHICSKKHRKYAFSLHKAQSIRIIIHGDGIRLLYACARVREAPILERIHPSGGSVEKYRGSVGKFGASKFSYGAFCFSYSTPFLQQNKRSYLILEGTSTKELAEERGGWYLRLGDGLDVA